MTRPSELNPGAHDQAVADLLDAAYRFAIALCHDDHLASDMVQDAWVSVLQAGRHVPDRSYLFRSVYTRWIDYCRKKPRIVLTEDDFSNSLDQVSDPQDEGEIESAISKALEHIRPQERAVLVLTLIEGLSAKEAAELLAIPRNTVLSLAKRGRDRLRQLLQQWYKEVC